MPTAHRPALASASARVNSLFTRFDGPVPVADLTAAMTGEPLAFLRQRSHGREVDRSARDLTKLISVARAGVSATGPTAHGPKARLDELCRCLRYYRDLGASLT